MGLTDKNLYAYCDNNPVSRADDGGEFWNIVIGAVVGAVAGAVSNIVSQVTSGEEINWKAVGISAASGAISGAVTAACPCAGPVATGIFQGTLSAATYAATEKIAYGRDPSLEATLYIGITSGVVAGGMKYVAQSKDLVQCFIAGTLVATKNGLVPIEDIKPGDLVWATDENTGETSLKEVKQLFRNTTDEWIHLTANGEEIVCTPEHPFYSPVKGWTNACQLRVGDIFVTLNGEYVVLEKIQHELLESPETTYNFEVEGYHTYHVGNTGVLVHNKCGGAADIDSYSNLRKVSKGTGKEVHHIIEKRFAGSLNIDNTNQMESVILSKAQHRVYTNAWRQALPYGGTYSASEVLNAAKMVYRDSPILLHYVLEY